MSNVNTMLIMTMLLLMFSTVSLNDNKGSKSERQLLQSAVVMVQLEKGELSKDDPIVHHAIIEIEQRAQEQQVRQQKTRKADS